MIIRKISSLLFLTALFLGVISCKKDEESPPAPPAPVNQLTFNGQSKTLSHAYAISYEDDLFIDDEAYRYFEIVLSTRDISVFYLENAGTFDLDALESPIYANAGDSYVRLPIAVKESIFTSIEGEFRSINSAALPNRVLSDDATLLWNYTTNITSFANSFFTVSESVNSLVNITLTNAIEDNLRQNVGIVGFLSYNGLTSPVTFDFVGSMQYYITDVNPNDLLLNHVNQNTAISTLK